MRHFFNRAVPFFASALLLPPPPVTNKTLKYVSFFALALLLGGSWANTSFGVAISVNFPGNGAGVNVAPAQGAGVHQVGYWNNVAANTNAGTVNNLLGSTGVATTASVNWDSNGTFSVGGINAALSGNHAMMKGHLDARASGFPPPLDTTVTFSNIPANFGSYDVYVYFDGNLADGSVNSNYTIGSQTFYIQDTATFSGAFVQGTGTTPGTRTAGANYVRFENLTGPGFSMIADSESFRAEVAGIQVVSRAVGKHVDLADIVGGGNGSGNGVIGVGIDQLTGNLVTPAFDRPAQVAGQGFRPVVANPFVDGVFVTDGGLTGVQQYATTGATFSGAPDTNNATWDTIENRPNNASGSILSGVNYNNVNGNTMIALHANNGITFDLDAIEANQGREVVAFSAVAGLATTNTGGSATFWVYLDGILMESQVINAVSGNLGVGFDLEFAIASDARFLTLVATDNGNGIGNDQIIFGNARLHLAVPEPATAMLALMGAAGLLRRRRPA